MENTVIKLLKDEDLSWPFDGQPAYYLPTQYAGWGRTENVDPFPCYTHDIELVKEVAYDTLEKFNIPNPVSIFALSHECTSRTNGWHTEYGIYDTAKEKTKTTFDWESMIALHGKRIPIMRIMTEYLVSHELGHRTEKFLSKKMKFGDEDREAFLTQYCKARGVDYKSGYGGRKWHLNAGEIFANDFRIIICNRVPEFWPHEVEHPTKCQSIINWWEAAKEWTKPA